jgi:ribonuclease H2 subunit A
MKGFVDTLGPADKYEARLTDLFPGIKFTVRSKADSLFPVVGAASIVAKVTRDRTLRAWFADAECGCGYPSDPKTVAWLKANMDPVFGFSNLVRFSWSSCERLLDADGVKFEWHSEKADKEARKASKHSPSLITAPLKPSSNW